jgi:uncharacterized membrane protein YdcZ (DUF606 family)
MSDTLLRVIGWTCLAGVVGAGGLWLADVPYATYFGVAAVCFLLLPALIMFTFIDDDRRLTAVQREDWKHAARHGVFFVVVGFFFVFRRAPRGRVRRRVSR